MNGPVPNPAQPVFREYDAEKAARAHRLKILALSLVALALFLAGQAVVLSRWIAVDTRPPAWDQSIHLETAFDCKVAKAEGRGGDCWRPVPKPGMPPFPPLYHLALQRAMGAPDPAHAALWVNFLYFALLTVSVWGIVFRFRSDWVAPVGAVAFVCSPAVQELLYTPLVDVAVAAVSAAAFWAFLASDGFAEWIPSLLFGVLFGVGMLHKWSFFSYMIVPAIVGLQALGRRGPKAPALAAWTLGAAISLPWYVMNWPLLLPRLVQASSDFAVPFWQGGAALTYLWTSVGALGPALWFMGFVGIIVPRYRRNDHQGWLIPVWILCSYVFWTIVPNRQMRFLLPGLPGLAVMATGTWPSALIALMAGAQLFGAVNYARGLIGPITIPTPVGGIALLPNDPARREDWHIDDALKEAEKRHDPSAQVADLVLIANHPRFNGPTFTWRRRALGLEHVRVRGVNKRLCELAQFVLLKGGDLGPAGVIGDLPKAAKVVTERDSWFPHGYDKAATWPLPDGSVATLYERAKPRQAPFRLKGPLQLQFYTQGGVQASAMVIDLGPWDAAQGVYPHARAYAQEVEAHGVRISRPSFEADDLFLVSASAPGTDEWDDIRVLKLKTLRVNSLAVSADAIRTVLVNRIKGLKLDSFILDKTVKAVGSFRGVGFSFELSLEVTKERPRALNVRFVSLRLGPNPMPVAAINRIKELTIPLDASPELPFTIELPGLTLANDRLTIP